LTSFLIDITGQDGSYLAEFLLEKDYKVHGIKRRASSFNTQRQKCPLFPLKPNMMGYNFNYAKH